MLSPSERPEGLIGKDADIWMFALGKTLIQTPKLFTDTTEYRIPWVLLPKLFG